MQVISRIAMTNNVIEQDLPGWLYAPIVALLLVWILLRVDTVVRVRFPATTANDSDGKSKTKHNGVQYATSIIVLTASAMFFAATLGIPIVARFIDSWRPELPGWAWFIIGLIPATIAFFAGVLFFSKQRLWALALTGLFVQVTAICWPFINTILFGLMNWTIALPLKVLVPYLS